MKNRIRLTESQLHQVIKESVKKVLREGRVPLAQVAAVKRAHKNREEYGKDFCYDSLRFSDNNYKFNQAIREITDVLIYDRRNPRIVNKIDDMLMQIQNIRDTYNSDGFQDALANGHYNHPKYNTDDDYEDDFGPDEYQEEIELDRELGYY